MCLKNLVIETLSRPVTEDTAERVYTTTYVAPEDEGRSKVTEEPDIPEQWLLVSDIDDTLTGNKAELEHLCRLIDVQRPSILIALNSSRPYRSVDVTLSDYFPDGFEPDAVITGLGTEIRLNGVWLESWQQQFESWPDEEVRNLLVQMGFEPHSEVYQTEGKASFAVPDETAVEMVSDRLKLAGIPFKTIYSGKSDLDILAPGAGKDRAMRYLANELGIAQSRTVAAGDSGNDLALFEAAGKAIAVGNARSELLEKMPLDKTYHASAAHAAGVAEGLQAFGLLPKAVR